MRLKGFCLVKYNPDAGWQAYIEKEAEFMKNVLGIGIPLSTDFFKQHKPISHCNCKPKDITKTYLTNSNDDDNSS